VAVVRHAARRLTARPLRSGLVRSFRTGIERKGPILERAWSSLPGDAGTGSSMEPEGIDGSCVSAVLAIMSP
jgi:hypothetical protein